MSMTIKLWAAHFTGSKTEGKFSIHDLNAYGPHTPYIRADITEDLARALTDVIVAHSSNYFGSDAEKHKRAAVRGALRKARKALASYEPISPAVSEKTSNT